MEEYARTCEYGKTDLVIDEEECYVSWETLVNQLSDIIETTRDILVDFRKEDSEFVLEEAYQEIVGSLSAREFTIGKLLRMKEPTNKEDIKILTQLVKSYRHLVGSLNQASRLLVVYIKEN